MYNAIKVKRHSFWVNYMMNAHIDSLKDFNTPTSIKTTNLHTRCYLHTHFIWAKMRNISHIHFGFVLFFIHMCRCLSSLSNCFFFRFVVFLFLWRMYRVHFAFVNIFHFKIKNTEVQPKKKKKQQKWSTSAYFEISFYVYLSQFVYVKMNKKILNWSK